MKVGGVTTTEVCNISCTMCHFNGPQAIRKAGTLTPEQVKKYVTQLPPGQEVGFAGNGELFMDPHALEHLRATSEAGHKPFVLTNGQLLTPTLMDQILEAGVRLVRISVDSIDPDHYRKVRQGGELSVILAACEYLNQQKAKYPDLRIEVNNTMFLNTFPRQDEFVEFWRGKVDAVNFNAEYYNIFKFRNKFYEPEERNDCDLSVYLLPTGQMAPCCAMMVYQHYNEVDWLPHIDDTTPEEAYDRFTALYNNPDSDFRKICAGCDWWITSTKGENGNNPYWRSVQLTEPVPVLPPVEASPATDLAVAEANLQNLQADLHHAVQTIQAMESSKFWRIRMMLARFKRALGIKDPAIYAQPAIKELKDAAQFEAELERLNAAIEWMGTSKFWKLRTTWLQLKQRMGLLSPMQ